jgi:uncharacterized glyoxalase superfamily protein PhnB
LNAQRDGQLQLISDAWLVAGFEPIFKVTDVSISADWFRCAGFDVSFHDESYAFAHRERDLTVHLARTTEDAAAGHGVLYLHCQDADRVAEEWKQAGLDVIDPRDEEYGKREGSASDPDGNVIRFGSPMRRVDS